MKKFITIVSMILASTSISFAEMNADVYKRMVVGTRAVDVAFAMFESQIKSAKNNMTAKEADAFKCMLQKIRKEDFFEPILKVYKKNISPKDASVLADFFESESGARFTNALIQFLEEGKEEPFKRIIGDLDKNEDFLKAAASFKSFNEAQPVVQQEMKRSGLEMAKQKIEGCVK